MEKRTKIEEGIYLYGVRKLVKSCGTCFHIVLPKALVGKIVKVRIAGSCGKFLNREVKPTGNGANIWIPSIFEEKILEVYFTEKEEIRSATT